LVSFCGAGVHTWPGSREFFALLKSLYGGVVGRPAHVTQEQGDQGQQDQAARPWQKGNF
jgi:hypothetical protein